MENKDVSIIICTYNEESTVVDVINACRESVPKAEIIVVDDGSTDGSEMLLRKANKTIPFHYVKLDENHGKSYAMVVGVEKAKNDIILFFDADVTDIKDEHFKKILQPILSREADMVLGSPSETLIDHRVNPFKIFTGERALRKEDILPILDDIRDIKFGVETYLNLYYQAHGKKIKYLLMEGLTHPTKYKKVSPVQATREFISEGQDIAITLLKNHDLITKRIENSFVEQNESMKQKIMVMQNQLNEKIRSFFTHDDKK